MTPSRLRWAALLAGALLLIGLRAAPSLPSAAVLPVSLLWVVVLVLLLRAGYRVLRTGMPAAAAMAVVTAGVLLPILLTALPFPASVAVRLPCPRNWTWMPTWQLRPSPMGSVSFSAGGTPVKICYGRPAARGRTMLGSKIPFGRLWRTGANEPTTIITPRSLRVAGVRIPAGRTALYTIPGPETWEIILNGSTSQWGIESEYTEAVRSHELGHAIVPSEAVAGDRVERLRLVPDSAGIVLEWEKTRVRIPFAPDRE